MAGVHLGQDTFDDLALPDLGEHEDLVRDGACAVIGGPQEGLPAIAQRQHVLGP
jgi:hypothetical protein